MKIIIGQDPYPARQRNYCPYIISVPNNDFPKYNNVIQGNNLNAIRTAVAFVPLFIRPIDPFNIISYRRVLSLCVGPEMAVEMLTESQTRIATAGNNLELLEGESKRIVKMLHNQDILLLNVRYFEKVNGRTKKRKNPFINNVFRYYSTHDECELILLGYTAKKAWQTWSRNNQRGRQQPTMHPHPRPRRNEEFWELQDSALNKVKLSVKQ